MSSSPNIRQRARELRKNLTPAERLLWSRLRDRQLGGLKFRRQHPLLDRFIVDFYCAERRLAVEVDGDVHAVQRDRDAVRTEVLEAEGYRVVRFANAEVLKNTEAVLEAIGRACGLWEGEAS